MQELPRPALPEPPIDRIRRWLSSSAEIAPGEAHAAQPHASAAGPRHVPAGSSVPDGPGRNVDAEASPAPAVAASNRISGPGVRGPAWLAERPVLAVVAVAVSTAMAVMVAAIGVSAWQGRSGPPVEELLPIVSPVAPIPTAAPVMTPAEPIDHVIHVAGAVTRPGVVRVIEGSRVVDAIDAAGGALADADLDRLNLASPVIDGQRVHVPLIGEESPPIVASMLPGGSSSGSPGADDEGSRPVELNAATGRDLESLNGVGPATAAAILDFRDRNGPFITVDDLLDVPGIGPAKLEGLRSQVSVAP